MREKVIETKICKHCKISFDVTDKDIEFYQKVSPVIGGKKYNIPTPTLCPDCRQQRLFSHRNDRKIGKRKCDATGIDIFSTYSQDKPYKVYNKEYWRSDKWDPISYQKNFDFNRGFFEQFNELILSIPHLSTTIVNSENSDYCIFSSGVKNSYLSQRVGNGENIYYTYLSLDSNNLFDCYNVHSSEHCYFCIDSENCYKTYFSQNAFYCKNSMYLFNCRNCEYCAFSTNMDGGKFYYFNKQFSEKEYNEKINQFNSLSLSEKNKIIGKFYENISHSIVPNIYGISNENVEGSYIFSSKNIKNSFDVVHCEDCSYSTGIAEEKNVIDSAFGYYVDKSFSQSSGVSCSNLICIYNCNNSNHIMYSMLLLGCSYCFGCFGLKNKQYCIFNKQFTKQEYEKLVSKIIEHMQKTGEWGEFFPSSISPFGYNETVAQEYFPLTKDEALNSGFKWSDYEVPFPKVEKIIPANKLPENITDIPDDILNWAIMPDEIAGNTDLHSLQKPFRIIKQELEFYRKHNLPIPRKHPEERHLDRMKLRNERKIYDRKCDKCGIEIKTTYSSERKEIVYCEECYNKEIY